MKIGFSVLLLIFGLIAFATKNAFSSNIESRVQNNQRTDQSDGKKTKIEYIDPLAEIKASIAYAREQIKRAVALEKSSNAQTKESIDNIKKTLIGANRLEDRLDVLAKAENSKNGMKAIKIRTMKADVSEMQAYLNFRLMKWSKENHLFDDLIAFACWEINRPISPDDHLDKRNRDILFYMDTLLNESLYVFTKEDKIRYASSIYHQCGNKLNQIVKGNSSKLIRAQAVFSAASLDAMREGTLVSFSKVEERLNDTFGDDLDFLRDLPHPYAPYFVAQSLIQKSRRAVENLAKLNSGKKRKESVRDIVADLEDGLILLSSLRKKLNERLMGDVSSLSAEEKEIWGIKDLGLWIQDDVIAKKIDEFDDLLLSEWNTSRSFKKKTVLKGEAEKSPEEKEEAQSSQAVSKEGTPSDVLLNAEARIDAGIRNPEEKSHWSEIESQLKVLKENKRTPASERKRADTLLFEMTALSKKPKQKEIKEILSIISQDPKAISESQRPVLKYMYGQYLIENAQAKLNKKNRSPQVKGSILADLKEAQQIYQDLSDLKVENVFQNFSSIDHEQKRIEKMMEQILPKTAVAEEKEPPLADVTPSRTLTDEEKLYIAKELKRKMWSATPPGFERFGKFEYRFRAKAVARDCVKEGQSVDSAIDHQVKLYTDLLADMNSATRHHGGSKLTKSEIEEMQRLERERLRPIIEGMRGFRIFPKPKPTFTGIPLRPDAREFKPGGESHKIDPR